MRIAYALASLLFVSACSDRGLDPGGRAYDFTTTPLDFATSPIDFAINNDASVPGGCGTFPFSDDQGQFAGHDDPSSTQGFDWDVYVEAFQTSATDPTLVDVVYYEYSHPEGAAAPTLPHPVDFTNPLGADYVGLVTGYDPTGQNFNAGTYYVATSGSAIATHLDDSTSGEVAMTGSNIVFREIDDSGEILPNGSCVALDSLVLDSTYSN